MGMDCGSKREAVNMTFQATRRALFMCAAHCQGGHSDAGAAAAEALGISFPITMEALESKALSEGFSPADLWPWLTRTRQNDADKERYAARKEP